MKTTITIIAAIVLVSCEQFMKHESVLVDTTSTKSIITDTIKADSSVAHGAVVPMVLDTTTKK